MPKALKNCPKSKVGHSICHNESSLHFLYKYTYTCDFEKQQLVLKNLSTTVKGHLFAPKLLLSSSWVKICPLVLMRVGQVRTHLEIFTLLIMLKQRTLTIGESITIQLVFSLIDDDSIASTYFLIWSNPNKLTGDQLYRDTSPCKVSECYVVKGSVKIGIKTSYYGCGKLVEPLHSTPQIRCCNTALANLFYFNLLGSQNNNVPLSITSYNRFRTINT